MENLNVTYDIFCDASVGPELRGCCSGALIERRESINNFPQRVFHYTIQPNGTNNSGESAAVALGVSHAINLHNFMKELGYRPKFNLFSDSLITIKGVREWLPGWVKNSDRQGNLRNYSGNITANQEFFKYIYNSILGSDIDINFFHQDGHVTHNFDSIKGNFMKFNGLLPEDIGKTCTSLCLANDFVDKETRGIINTYLTTPKESLPSIWEDDQLNFTLSTCKCDRIYDHSAEGIEIYRMKVAYH